MAPAFISFALLGGFGGGEVLLVFFIVLILFGGDKMPELARGLGKVLRDFKKATSGVEDEIKRALAEPPPPNRTVKTFPPYPPSVTPPIAPPPAIQPPDETPKS